MVSVTLSFFNELKDLITARRRNSRIELRFNDKRSVKDLIESVGVPHTEVDIILVNGKSVDFRYSIHDGDSICVYPVCETEEPSGAIHLAPISRLRGRFIADTNIHDIVRYMRALGLDVYFNPSLSPRGIIDISRQEDRIILTRSKSLLKHNDAVIGFLLRRGQVEAQIRDIINRFAIRKEIKPFSRCLNCNTLLAPVDKNVIEERIPNKTRAYCDKYAICPSCDKIYWEGSHVMEMKKVIEEILKTCS
ncbi:conserved hypothetical protein [uncultured Desulfobacterium sp.]|uniref:Twitching motility protein PilT n=1 Tax=uncultured Desulfobacterium sp. TaxID=201089 RepID=A0A445MZU4_9BACT|nr:conserved hypothetical protein [uncultured Desulfobacterium sp.]